MASASAPDTGHELPSGLELTELEATLRRLLLDVAHHIDTLSTPPSSGSEVALPPSLKDAKVELRFTGGWVRDKLLRVGSHDIDVAVNKMTGYQFGKHMIDYINIPGNRDKYHVSNSSAISDNQGAEGQDASSRGLSMGDLHKIEANPEKSKHLETVTTRILGLDVDIVNLRKESYTEDSRNPQMEFGTPEEDALRRDATVNALFYNLNTSKLEDFTGKGFDDLGNKIMRTPMEPHQTFKDDPLRVLRMIRFASRLGYSIHHDAEAAMSAAAIKQALKAKISRERVGVEVEKMLRGNDPHAALVLIDRLGLYSTIFTDPTRENIIEPDTRRWKVAYGCARILINGPQASEPDDTAFATSPSVLRSTLIRNTEEAYTAWMLAALAPWFAAPDLDPQKPGGKPQPPAAAAVAREAIKANNKLFAVLEGAFRSVNDVWDVKNKLVTQQREGAQRPGLDDKGLGRDTLGLKIRRWGPNWRSHVLLALLLEVYQRASSGTDLDGAGQDDILKEYVLFLEHLKERDLLDVTTLRPLMDGKELSKSLDLKPGKWMKEALEVVMAWQLRHPGSQDTNAAVEEVRRHKETLGLP